MKENSQKKVLLSVLGVAILVVAVIGISFAAYTATFDTGENSISTGTIMVSYTESDNAINITNAPTDDVLVAYKILLILQFQHKLLML